MARCRAQEHNQNPLLGELREGLVAPGSKCPLPKASSEVRRRYAILDDNDRLLDERLRRLARTLPSLARTRVVAANVIGSVAEGRARDGSDIDLVLILDEGNGLIVLSAV